MLARLRPEQLERIEFPLGELDKPRVRELARAAGLPVADKPESQDLCFLAGVGGDRFLERHGDERLGERAGELVDERGEVVGRHPGQHRFTVGQRRGLGIGGRGEPLYVLGKDARSGRVTVGPRAALECRSVRVGPARLHRPAAAVDSVKLRYRQPPLPCRVAGAPAAGDHARLTLDLHEPVHGVAPGQTAALLAGDLVVGAALIAGAA
jgi:tRNA-specific 2-thiouridylase